MATAIRKFARRIKSVIDDPHATATLQDLATTLDSQHAQIDLARLYDLNLQDFELAMELIVDWRFRRYTHQGSRLRELIAVA